jgi:hypothetical protein
MKCFFSVLLFICSQHVLFTGVEAQSTTASNVYCNNPCYLGWDAQTTNALNIKTAGTTRMTILGTNGHIGIGTSSPGRLLEIRDGSGGPQLRLAYGTPYADIKLTSAGNLALLPSDGSNDGNIGIGLSNPDGRLHSEYAYVSGTTPLINGKFIVAGNAANGTQIEAVRGTCTAQAGTATCTNFGGKFAASNASTNIGVGGFIGGSSSSSSTSSGVYGDAGGQGSTLFWAGYFNGQIFCTTGAWNSSDEIFKTGKEEVSNTLALIKQMTPYTYYFDTVQFKFMNFPSAKQYGLVAEELSEIVPDLVRSVTSPLIYDDEGTVISDSLTFKAINYTELIPILIGGVQELAQKVSELQSQLDACCQGTGNRDVEELKDEGSGKGEIVELHDYIVLQQNVPNPFAEQTGIEFFVPSSVDKAEIIFYDASGHMINSKIITARGAGKIVVYGQDLSDGAYSYSLFADTKLIQSMKMVKSKN